MKHRSNQGRVLSEWLQKQVTFQCKAKVIPQGKASEVGVEKSNVSTSFEQTQHTLTQHRGEGELRMRMSELGVVRSHRT